MNHKEHKFYELGYNAHRNVSHFPDKRAVNMVDYWIEIENMVEKTILSDDSKAYWLKRLENVFTSWLSAKSRCASSFITGGSGFNVARAEKANMREHNWSCKLSEDIKIMEKQDWKARNPDAGGVSSDDKNAVEKLTKKVADLERWHETMKKANVIIRKNIKNSTPMEAMGLLEKLGIKPKEAHDLCFPTYGGAGFTTYQLSLNNANIKRLKGRIKELESKKNIQTKSIVVTDKITVIQNMEANRIQFVFDGKPSADIITLLKSKAFKWSPKQGLWQRMITGNAIYTTKRLMQTMKEM